MAKFSSKKSTSYTAKLSSRKTQNSPLVQSSLVSSWLHGFGLLVALTRFHLLYSQTNVDASIPYVLNMRVCFLFQRGDAPLHIFVNHMYHHCELNIHIFT